jgi:chromosome partitioning protein
MALVIGVISQKGGVGKSTLSRAIATEYARNAWTVKIADFDLSQGTVTAWNSERMANGIDPTVSVEQFSSVRSLEKQFDNYDLIVIDGAPASNRQTLEIAEFSNILVLPTKTTLDDLRPQIKLAHELRKNGISLKKIGFVLSMVGRSTGEIDGAVEYIEEAGYKCFGIILQKDSIGQAHDSGRAANETPFKSVNDTVDKVIQDLVNHIQKQELFNV